MLTPILAVILAILIGFCGCVVIYLQIFYGLLYYHLYKHHQRYYQSIGSPTLSWTWYPLNNYPLSLFKGEILMYKWLNNGLPKNFPKDKRCRGFKAANLWQRKYLPRLMLAWGLCVFLFALGCAVYLATHPMLPHAVSH